MRMFKGIITSVTDGDYQKVVSGIGRSNEDVVNRSYYQHVGFTSIPPADSVGVFIVDGDNVSMVASADPVADRPSLSNEKDVAIYADENKYVKIAADGAITVKNNNNTITLKANGDIELGSSALRALMTDAIIAKFNTHTHAGVTVGTGLTAVPTPLFLATDATLKTEAQ